MRIQLKLVHDGITPHLNRIAAALGRPIHVRIPAPLSAQLRIFQEAQAKARGQAAPAERRHPFPPHLKAQLDRHARAEAYKIIRSLR